jgi:glutamyl-tRNA reductase
MADIVLIGLNHTTAPVELRECIAFSPEDTLVALDRLKQEPSIDEVLVYSTCNRVEILLVTDNSPAAVDITKKFIASIHQIPLEQFENFLYQRENDDAVRHVFRVASSLDSMIVGEPQILGQIKSAYQTATEQKASALILNRLLHRAFFVAKKVRTETGIGDRAVSISYAAIELSKKIFDSLEKKKVLMIGAGEMAELAVEHLIRHKIGDLHVANRTFERGVSLAEKFKGQAVRFEEIPQWLEQVDIIISSTGSPELVLHRDQVKAAMRVRRNRPLFLIDIAVPRDIDPEINRLNNAYVYDVDDLQNTIEENLEDRKKEALKGERIVDEAVIRFRDWYDNLNVVPTIVDLRNKLRGIIENEIERTLPDLQQTPSADQEALKKMIGAMVNKIMHDPTRLLKMDGHHINKPVYLDLMRRLFNLDE